MNVKRMTITLLVWLAVMHSAQASNCSSDTGVAARYQILGEDLDLGDELTLTIGGYTINYLVNDFSKDAGQWPRYLATEINAVVPESLAKAGDVSNNYLPVASSTDNRLDILQADIPVMFLKNGVDYSFSLQRVVVTSGVNAGQADIPHLRGDGLTITEIVIQNISDREITVNFNQKLMNRATGLLEDTSLGNLYGSFSTTNNPLLSQGAIMPPQSMGYVEIHFISTNYFGSGEITWQSVDCGSPPVRSSVEHYYYQGDSSGRGGISVYHLNNANPF